MTTPNKKYALHPGHVTSVNDGDIHFISVAQLARLYKLRPSEYVIWNGYGMNWNDYIHLFPREDGNYDKTLG